MSTKKERMYQKIRQHGENLLKIFPNATEQDPVKLCKKLLSLENKAHKITTDNCNGLLQEWEYTQEISKITKKVCNILNNNVDIMVNGDCRGYALKISDIDVIQKDLKIYRDFGGYGILAPDFRG